MPVSCPAEVCVSDRVELICDGVPAVVAVSDGESLLTVLREQLGVVSVKDGCAPQGQCGCCTVLIDGEPRVACVTPALRVAGRRITTIGGVDPAVRDALVDAFVACGGSQCGFCTPGIIVRVASLIERGRTARVDVDRALAAHLCRCTGWQPIVESITSAANALDGCERPTSAGRDPRAAARRAELEGGVGQRVDRDVPCGGAGFADDSAPRDALVAIPRPPGSAADAVEAAGLEWVVADTLDEARARAGKVQGRRTTRADGPPIAAPVAPPGGVALATQWVEPAYLEPDASWCEPGGEPATPLANGGAFGGKVGSPAPAAAHALAASSGRAVRVVYSREDTVRLGPKRPPIAAAARLERGTIEIVGRVVRGGEAAFAGLPCAYGLAIDSRWEAFDAPGPPVSVELRAFGLAEQALLVEGALAEAGVDRASVVSERAGRVLLDCVVEAGSGACAGARVHVEADRGLLSGVDVRIAAGDPLDEVVLHSYALGAVHMALGWVLSEGLAVDRETGEVLDLTIRSFGIIRARDLPPVTVTVVDDPGPPLGRAADAVFAAVAAATWNAVAAAEGVRPTVFPATATRAARSLRRALSGAAVTQRSSPSSRRRAPGAAGPASSLEPGEPIGIGRADTDR
jgi:xanthine dehydrogenase small subunit